MGDDRPESEKYSSRDEHHCRIHTYRTLVPRPMTAIGIVRQRVHDSLMDIQRRGAATQRFRFVVDLCPQVHSIVAARRCTDHGDADIAVEPLMQQRSPAAVRDRNFAIRRVVRKRTIVVARPRPGRLIAQFRVRLLLWSVQVIVHHAYFPSSRCWSASRALWTRILRAPTVVRSSSAI